MPPAPMTLWIDVPRVAFYLVPDAFEWPTGDLLLLTLAGQVQQVAAEAVAPFLIPQEQAQSHLQGQVVGLLGSVQATLTEIFANLPPLGREATAPEAAPPSTTPQQRSALELVAAILDMEPEQLRREPDVGRVGLAHLLRLISDLLRDSIDPDEARLAAAQARVAALHAALAANEVHVDPRLLALPQQVRAWYQSSAEPATFHRVADGLRATADRLRLAGRGGQGEGGVLGVLLQLGQMWQELFPAPPQPSPEEEAARYRQQARQAIDEVMGEGPRLFDFKAAWAKHQAEKQGPDEEGEG